MPLVTAANVPYSPEPSVKPSETPGPDYQNIPGISSEAFGAGVGRAQSQLGGAFEKSSDEFMQVAIQQQQLTNQIAANNSVNYAMDEVTKHLHGDPNKPGDVGFYGLKGLDAVNARQSTAQQVDQTISNARSQLTNPRQLLAFDNETRRMRNYWMGEIGRHYDQQLNVAAEHSATAGIQLSNQGMATTAANQDQAGFALAVEKRMKSEVDKLRAQGLSNDATSVDAAMGNARADATRVWADSIRDPVKALDFLDKNKDALKPGEYPAIRREYEAKALDAKAKALNYGSGPVAPAISGISHGYSVSDLYGLAIKAGYEPGQKAATAAAIAMAESSGNAGAHNTRGEDSYGLMQLNADAHGDLARTFDPLENMRRSMTISKGGTDWSPWSTYKHGNYQKFMPQAMAAASGTGGVQAQTIAAATPETVPVPGIRLASVSPDTVIPSRSMPARDETMVPDSEVGITINGETLPQRIQRLNEQTKGDDTLFSRAVTEARKQYNQAWTDHNHQLQAHAQLIKQQSEAAENQYLTKMFPVDGSPSKVTAIEINNDKYLTPESKMKLTSFYERQTKPEPAAAVSARTRSDLYERIIKDWGDPKKVLDSKPLDQAFINQTLTKADHDWLSKQLTDSRTAEGESLGKVKKNLIDTYKTAITKSNPLLGKLDNEGDINYGRYQKYVNDQVERAIKENKNPYDLFTEGGPNYLGRREVLRMFQEPMQNATKKISEQTKDNPYYVPPGTAVPSTPLTKPLTMPPMKPGEDINAYKKRNGIE